MSEPKDWHLSGLDPLDASPGPALRLSAQAADELAARVVARAQPQPARHRPTRPPWLLAAAIVAGTAAATAGTWVMLRTAGTSGVPVATPSAVDPPTHRHPSSAVVRRPHPSEDLSPAAEPSSSAPLRRSALPEQPSVSSVEPVPDLLRQANQLRGQGRWADAERAYSDVIRTNPRSAQAYVATLAAASLRLEHLGDPRGALRLYESALQGGSLNVEAALGAARCHRALGNRAAEAEALRRALAAGASGLVRRQTEQRLRDLEPGAP